MDTVAGTSGNDTINANPGASNANTFTALDNIDGGAGTDTLNVTEIGAAGAASYALSAAATVKNVEVLNYTVASDNVGDDVTADVSNWTGLTTANIVISGTDAPVTALTTKGNVTTVSVNGSTTAAITDSAAAGSDKLATVNLVDNSGLATITSDAVTALSLKGSSGGATVTAAAATRTLGLTLDGVTAGTVTDATATTLNITASGTETTAGTVVAGAATTVSIAADEALSLTALTVGAATGLTVTGDSLVTLAAATLTALTSIDASAQTAGGVDTKAFALGTGVTFTGGAGADSIQLGATTKTIAMGAGDDRVLLSATTTALGTDGSIDGGEGTGDVIAFADADDAGTASGATAFEGTISGFEVVELAGGASAGVALNLANLDDISKVTASADVGQVLTISNMATGGTLTLTAAQTAATTVGIKDAGVGTADVLNIVQSGSGVIAANTITANDVETINIASNDTIDDNGTMVAHTGTLSANAVKSITLSGDAGYTLTYTGTTVTSVDASGLTIDAKDATPDGFTWTSGALAAASTVTGGAGNDVIDLSAAVATTTLSGGAGADTLTGSSTKANTINGGDGVDAITGGSAADTIDGGAGDDVISGGAGLDQITGGAGNDRVVVALNSSGNIYATFKDAAAGDILDFAGAAAGAFNSTKIALAGTAVFQDYLDAAAAGNATDDVSWFQFNGNTYVVQDNAAGATFDATADLVIELTGLIDLSNSTIDGAATNYLTIV